MKFRLKSAIAFLVLVSSGAHADTEAQMKQAALHGDYQAQRNLAYSYANGWKAPGSSDYVPRKPVDACAWSLVVVMSSNPKVHTGDYGNQWIYCNKLSPTDSETAWKMAKKISKQQTKK